MDKRTATAKATAGENRPGENRPGENRHRVTERPTDNAGRAGPVRQAIRPVRQALGRFSSCLARLSWRNPLRFNRNRRNRPEETDSPTNSLADSPADLTKAPASRLALETGTLNQVCMNCETPLAGPFCQHCGQKHDDIRRPLWSFVMQIVDDLASADSRTWRTLLVLMLVPGRLGRDYNDGKRARFLPPLRVYLVATVLFFFALNMTDVAILDIQLIPAKAHDGQPQQQIRQQSQGAFPQSGERTESEEAMALYLTPGAKGCSNTAISDSLPYRICIGMLVIVKNERRFAVPPEHVRKIIDSIEADDASSHSMGREAVVGFVRVIQDPKGFNKLFNDKLPFAMALLIPVFALMLRLTHWGSRRYYMNQVIFALHYHSFLFLFLIAMVLAAPIVGTGFFGLLFWLVSSLYLIIALKVGQRQSWLRAFFKACLLYVPYLLLTLSTVLVFLFLGLQEA